VKTVLVEINSGIAEVVRAPKGTSVEIIDLDLLREGDVQDIEAYWNNRLSRLGQQYVKQHYPGMFRRLTAERIA